MIKWLFSHFSGKKKRKVTFDHGRPKRMHCRGLTLKLREQIHDFSGKLSAHFSRPKRRFVEQMIYGIQASGDVKLSEIARSLNEQISLLKT